MHHKHTIHNTKTERTTKTKEKEEEGEKNLRSSEAEGRASIARRPTHKLKLFHYFLTDFAVAIAKIKEGNWEKVPGKKENRNWRSRLYRNSLFWEIFESEGVYIYIMREREKSPKFSVFGGKTKCPGEIPYQKSKLYFCTSKKKRKKPKSQHILIWVSNIWLIGSSKSHPWSI